MFRVNCLGQVAEHFAEAEQGTDFYRTEWYEAIETGNTPIIFP
jgi:hypothetical protein